MMRLSVSSTQSVVRSAPRSSRTSSSASMTGLITWISVVLEVVERAGLIARGNARVSHGLRDSVLTPAVAPDDSSDTVILERSPAGVIAERTSHSIYNQ